MIFFFLPLTFKDCYCAPIENESLMIITESALVFCESIKNERELLICRTILRASIHLMPLIRFSRMMIQTGRLDELLPLSPSLSLVLLACLPATVPHHCLDMPPSALPVRFVSFGSVPLTGHRVEWGAAVAVVIRQCQSVRR